MAHYKTVVHMVRSPDQQHLGTCYRGKSSGPRSTISEALGVGPNPLCFSKPSRWFQSRKHYRTTDLMSYKWFMDSHKFDLSEVVMCQCPGRCMAFHMLKENSDFGRTSQQPLTFPSYDRFLSDPLGSRGLQVRCSAFSAMVWHWTLLPPNSTPCKLKEK